MKNYRCYQLWDFIEPDVVEMKFKDDQDALGYWLGTAVSLNARACCSIVRVDEINGVSSETFIAMFRQGQKKMEMIKSKAV